MELQKKTSKQRGTDIECPAKCLSLTERIEGDMGLVPYGSAFQYRNEAKQERGSELIRCEELCMNFLDKCTAKSAPVVDDNEAICANARQIWRNYLFVCENRPTKMEFLAPEDTKKMKRGYWKDSH